MNHVNSIEFYKESREELLPNLMPDFPYIASYVSFENYPGRLVPWHWHKEVELFYIKSGSLEYNTTQGTKIFPAGSGGLVNTNVLHMTRPQTTAENTIQLIHIFDTDFISGGKGSRIEKKYVAPVLAAAPQVDIIPFDPEQPAQAALIARLAESFHLAEASFGYEMTLRATLSALWQQMVALSGDLLAQAGGSNKINDKIKLMLIFIHEHYADKLTIADIAGAAFVSERDCFRLFQSRLSLTPIEYLTSYRLQMACNLLAESEASVSAIGHACGLGSSSYFGRVFRSSIGCSPSAYRQKWQNSDKKRR